MLTEERHLPSAPCDDPLADLSNPFTTRRRSRKERRRKERSDLTMRDAVVMGVRSDDLVTAVRPCYTCAHFVRLVVGQDSTDRSRFCQDILPNYLSLFSPLSVSRYVTIAPPLGRRHLSRYAPSVYAYSRKIPGTRYARWDLSSVACGREGEARERCSLTGT